MGEEEKKKPTAAAAEGKKEEKKAVELQKDQTEPNKSSKLAEEAAPPLPPPQEIVMRVYMHCEGCARKVRRCLKGFDGVEEVITECKTHKVIVKGQKADPLKVLQRVQKKSHRQVQLLSALLPKPQPQPPEETPPTEDPPKPPAPEEEKKQEVITVVLKVHMHCEACAQEIKKRILPMEGVDSAEADLKSSEVAVKGVMEPQKLVEYVYKRTGKHAVIVKQQQDPPEKKPPAATEEKKNGAGEEEDKKKGEEGGDQSKKEGVMKDESSNVAAAADQAVAVEESEEVAAEVLKMKNEYYYYYTYPPTPSYNYTQKYADVDTYHPAAAYPPQIFSDENPNACSVM